LHFHPESSTSVLSGNNLDEYDVIRSIAFNLPEGTTLFVKDHKSAWGYPPLKFYQKLKRLPNVKVLSPDEPTKQLIKKSIGIITLTSTVGYEALLLEKPVILLGRVFYESHKNVFILKSREDIFSALNNVLSRVPEDTTIYNQQFVQAYWLSTHEGTLNLTKQEALDEKQSDRIAGLLNI
jgi:CDP-glycerol glycerophosphotransferase (TagB/SpsB family)